MPDTKLDLDEIEARAKAALKPGIQDEAARLVSDGCFVLCVSPRSMLNVLASAGDVPALVARVRELEADTRCSFHAGQSHGKEAEELRAGIESAIANVGTRAGLVTELRYLLDQVDARDSLMHLEAIDELEAVEEERDATIARAEQAERDLEACRLLGSGYKKRAEQAETERDEAARGHDFWRGSCDLAAAQAALFRGELESIYENGDMSRVELVRLRGLLDAKDTGKALLAELAALREVAEAAYRRAVEVGDPEVAALGAKLDALKAVPRRADELAALRNLADKVNDAFGGLAIGASVDVVMAPVREALDAVPHA